ncbi:kinase-like protein, partial [Lepidopterella palustris CBS 459.81]
DLITFLAVVQKLQIDILPIRWQPERLPIGAGATGKINEALINLHTSFAFKCVSDRQKLDESEAKILQAFVSEIVVLGHPLIREHPNIAKLQGICWDISSDDKVWPVLVFEKTQYGDLYNFITLPVGRDLRIAERLKLCVDVGVAIMDMHSNKIIHGDIKPENVLVYKDDAGAYTARVTDFGYSTRFANEDDLILVPKSWPWDAPEHHFDSYKPYQARRMDVFMFGMLCLWVMFEKYL